METHKKKYPIFTEPAEIQALTRAERVLLGRYRRLSEREQQAVFKLLEGLERISELES